MGRILVGFRVFFRRSGARVIVQQTRSKMNASFILPILPECGKYLVFVSLQRVGCFAPTYLHRTRPSPSNETLHRNKLFATGLPCFPNNSRELR